MIRSGCGENSWPLYISVDGNNEENVLGRRFLWTCFVWSYRVLHCVWKKRDQNVFCDIFYKTRAILVKYDT